MNIFSKIVTFISGYRHGFGSANRFIGYSQVVTTMSCFNLKVVVIITHKYSLLYLLALVVAA
jgi:hypothetical protein